MASDYLHNSLWKKKSNEDENIPESIRRPEGYVEPKKEESKRDPEKEKAQWEQTPEGIRRPAAVDFESFGLRDAIDKNVKMMTDEEIAAERAAEKEKRAALIQPKKEQKKEEAKADPKQEQHHAESAAVSSNAERPSVAQPQPTVTATTKYEIINGQEIRERMKDFINSSPELKNISSEDREAIIKRLGDSKTAEEMKNKRFLIGEVNGQPMMHLLSEQESEKFNVLSGKKRDQYAAQLLESESKTLGSLVTDTQIKMIQEQGNREDSGEKVQASTSQKTKNEFSYASSPLELLLQMLFKMFGLDFMNKSSQQQNQQQSKTNQTTTSGLSTGPIERGRQTIPDEMLRCFRTDITPDDNITDGKKATVTQICVHSGDMLLGKMTEEEKKTNADIAGKYVIEGEINGQQISKVIDKDTFDRLENMYQGDRAEEFCKIFNLDENKLDFSRIRFGEGTPTVAYKGAIRNAVDYWRGLEVKEMPESAKAVLEPSYCIHGTHKDGTKFQSSGMTPEMFYRYATMNKKDQQEYLDRWLGPGSSGIYFTNASGKVVDMNSELRKTGSSAEQHIKEVSNMQVKADGGKYHMVAIVDGKEESREITELLYGKFNALDDRSRLRLFNKVFGIADGQSVKVADKAIAMETDQDNSVKRSAESGKQAQGQSWKNSDYAALAAMNFEQEEMNKSQQEHRSNGLRI